MTKFTVTPELATLIKTMRSQSKISSKDLARHVGKSPSYISKLESGDIRMVQESELTEILDYIVAGDDFYKDKLPAVIRALASFQNPELMAKQLWLIYYDTTQRQLTLPMVMLDDINTRLSGLHLDVHGLTERINSNKDSAMSAAFPANEVVEYTFRDKHLLLIRIEVEEDKMSALLQKKELNTNYATIHALVFTLIRLELFDDEELTAEQAQKTLLEARIYLDRYGVHSLTEYNSLVASTNFLNNQQKLLSVFSAANAEVIDQIITSFHLASEHDLLNTAQSLEIFKKNLEWDPAFTLKLIEQPFYKLGNTSFNLKKQLLDDMGSLLEKYLSIPDFEKTIESY